MVNWKKHYCKCWWIKRLTFTTMKRSFSGQIRICYLHERSFIMEENGLCGTHDWNGNFYVLYCCYKKFIYTAIIVMDEILYVHKKFVLFSPCQSNRYLSYPPCSRLSRRRTMYILLTVSTLISVIYTLFVFCFALYMEKIKTQIADESLISFISSF